LDQERAQGEVCRVRTNSEECSNRRKMQGRHAKGLDQGTHLWPRRKWYFASGGRGTAQWEKHERGGPKEKPGRKSSKKKEREVNPNERCGRERRSKIVHS